MIQEKVLSMTSPKSRFTNAVPGYEALSPMLLVVLVFIHAGRLTEHDACAKSAPAA
jgi:hypothetical protein